MPRSDKVKRWDSPEIIKVLKYINDNFDPWFEHRRSTCANAITAVNLDGRDAKSVYVKLNALIRSMEHYLKTRKKSNPRDIIWENKKINNLLKEICRKSKEKREKDEKDDNQGTTSQGTIKVKKTTNTDQATTNASTSQMDVDDAEVIDLETPIVTVDNLDINRDTLKDAFDANYQEIRVLEARISQRQSERQAIETELQAMETELKEKKEQLQNVYRQMGGLL